MQASNKRRVVLYSVAAVTLSGLVYGGFIHKGRPTPGMLISAAQAQLQFGLYDEATPFVEDLLDQEPDSFDGLLMWAAILEHRKDFAGARELYRTLGPRTEVEELRAEIQVGLARMELEVGEPSQALKTLKGMESETSELSMRIDMVRAQASFELGDAAAVEAAVLRIESNAPEGWDSAEFRRQIGMEPLAIPEVEPEPEKSDPSVQGGEEQSR